MIIILLCCTEKNAQKHAHNVRSVDLTVAVHELTDCVSDLKNITLSANKELYQSISQLDAAIDGNPSVVEPAFSEVDPNVRHPCGGTPGWRRVAYFNFSDTRYLCPAGWRLHQEPTRACGRASHEELTCDSVFFPVDGGPYTQICGHVLGYQFGVTAAFYASVVNKTITIDDSYVTGVSITYGNLRQHVWTYAVGRFEGSYYYNRYVFQICPCEHIRDIRIPDFVGAYWYCESGDNTFYGQSGYNLFSDDLLWDGEGCRISNTCCQFEGPVYFTRTVHEAVNDPIEIRICNYYTSQYSDVLISHLELYVK